MGRLSFYTPNANSSDTFSTEVNQFNSADNAEVIDVIPSNNSLRMSIDNAYTFMLGAINISERDGDYETNSFTLRITQPYQYTFYCWESECEGECGEYRVKEGKVTSTHSHKCSSEDCEIPEYKCSYEPYVKTVTVNDNQNVSFQYTIQHAYKFYKVKNIRLYTISKIQLHDGYDSYGLPLLDGLTHTVYPVDQYYEDLKKTAYQHSTRSEYIKKNGNKVGLRDGKPLLYTSNNTLEYSFDDLDEEYKSYYDEEAGEYVYETETKGKNLLTPKANTRVNAILDKLNHSTAATFYEVDDDEEVVPNSNSADNLKCELQMWNDRIYYTDTLADRTVYIVGNEKASTEKPSLTSEEQKYTDKYTSNENNAYILIDMSNYTKGYKKINDSSPYYYWNKEDPKSATLKKINVETKYPNDTSNYYMPKNNRTNVNYFNSDTFFIPKTRVNGLRYSYGTIEYTLTDIMNLSFDATDNKTSWDITQVKGNKGETFLDTEMHRQDSGKTKGEETLISNNSLPSVKFEYGGRTGSTTSIKKNADVVNVFNPVSFTTSLAGVKKGELVNHSGEPNKVQIQKNAEFTVNIEAKKHSAYSKLTSTKDYIGSYYIKFDFDVQNIKITDAKGTKRSYTPNVVTAGEWIGPIYNQSGSITAKDGKVSISAFALEDPLIAEGLVNQETNNYWVRGVANNAPNTINLDVKNGYIANEYVDKRDSNSTENNLLKNLNTEKRHYSTYYTQNYIYSDSNFVAEATVKSQNISRVYDFKVTDLKDVDWKNIFRKSTATTTNVHSSKAYYSGIKKWNIYTASNANELLIRDASEIGTNNRQILPLGPYKHTTTSYSNAPKMGYRFSFDLKTTGTKDNKEVVITPRFYYISKDGKTYIDSDHIKLFYKNSSNKYVDIKSYNLYFVPDDGYRLTFEGTDAAYRFSSPNLTISKNSISLGNTSKIKLTDKMKEESDNGFVQIWYGEYKLPNSTIAVHCENKGKSNEKYNINSPLKNGYIGVVFDIEVIEYTNSYKTTEARRISYGANDTNATSSINTSQWDYEGYLGFKSWGSKVTNLTMQLEKGTFDMNGNSQNKYGKSADTIYNEIKGTVILYDTDLTASSDYN